MKPVKIYTTTSCGYCVRAKELLGQKGVPYQEIDVTGDDSMRDELVRMSNGMRTVPQIFIGEQHVGGYTDLLAVVNAGRLDDLLR